MMASGALGCLVRRSLRASVCLCICGSAATVGALLLTWLSLLTPHVADDPLYGTLFFRFCFCVSNCFLVSFHRFAFSVDSVVLHGWSSGVCSDLAAHDLPCAWAISPVGSVCLYSAVLLLFCCWGCLFCAGHVGGVVCQVLALPLSHFSFPPHILLHLFFSSFFVFLRDRTLSLSSRNRIVFFFF